jgi:hypothetical protein
MAVGGFEFFYFYPRGAQTVLEPFDLLALLWFLACGFSVTGLVALGLRAECAGNPIRRRQLFAIISGASIALIVLIFEVVYPRYSIPFWWIGTVAIGLCWLGFGDGITQIIGGRRQLLWSFSASLLGIGTIIEIWSASHWLYSALAPSTLFGKTGADLEMNLTYAWSSLFPAIFLLAWVSPIWALILWKAYQWKKRRKLWVSRASDDRPAGGIKLGLDDFILVLVLLLLCVMIGFYPYFHDPSWLVGTDAYWRYRDPLERVAASPTALVAVSAERHGLYLLILYAIISVTGLTPFAMVKASPMILAALLSVLTYLAVAHFRGSRLEAFFAGFLSATTFPTTLGIFASIHANWLALSVSVVAFSILISLGRSHGKTLWKTLLAMLSGMSLMILHPWTWGIVALSALIAGLLFLAKKNWRMFAVSLSVLLSGLISGAFVFVAGSNVERARLIETIGTYSAPLTEPTQIQHPLNTIYDALRVWAPFLNPLLMILAMLGVVLIVCERSSSYKVFMLSWMVLAGIGTFFAVTLQTEIWRIWYVQPLWILGAAGIKGLLQIGSSDEGGGQIPYLVVARIAIITCVAGLAVVLLEPVVGSIIFYAAIISIATIHICGYGGNTKTVFVTAVILFVSIFFLDHALRSLYPLILNPHNFLEH